MKKHMCKKCWEVRELDYSNQTCAQCSKGYDSLFKNIFIVVLLIFMLSLFISQFYTIFIK